MTTQLSINLNDESATLLRQWSAEEGRTVTEVVRRMISLNKVIRDECVIGDKELRFVARDGSSTIVTLL